MNSSLPEISRALRASRLVKGLSQQALAAAAGISRTTLVQIEKGKDAQVSSIEAVGQVLGVAFGILAEAPDLARRRQARLENQAKLAASREKHFKIAAQLALGGEAADALKQNALHMVQLWREKKLCSPVYIDRWHAILDTEPRCIAQNLLAMDDEWGPALRQNTPFAIPAATL